MKILSLFGQLGKSRTLVFNVTALMLSVADLLQSSPLVMANPQVMAGLTTFILVANTILRFKTKTSVTEKSALLSNE